LCVDDCINLTIVVFVTEILMNIQLRLF